MASDEQKDVGTCPCGEPAVDVVHLSVGVKTCDACGNQTTEVEQIPACAEHIGAHMDGRLDGRMLLAAHSTRSEKLRGLALEVPPTANEGPQPKRVVLTEHGYVAVEDGTGGR